RHTRCYRDWSSDVCSSDLHRASSEPVMAPEESSIAANGVDAKERGDYHHYYTDGAYQAPLVVPSGMAWTRVQDYRMPDASGVGRSEERRVGRECGSWWWL